MKNLDSLQTDRAGYLVQAFYSRVTRRLSSDSYTEPRQSEYRPAPRELVHRTSTSCCKGHRVR
jgi:hypothetical protein